MTQAEKDYIQKVIQTIDSGKVDEGKQLLMQLVDYKEEPKGAA